MHADNEIKSLVKAARMLDCFTVERSELSLSALSTACGMHPSTVRRILFTLESIGFVAQDPNSRLYRLGMKLFELGHRLGEQLNLVRVAHPYLEEVVATTSETTYLTLFDKGEVLYIDRVESPQAVRLTSWVGQRLPAHSTGTGKIFLAHLAADELEKYFAHPLPRFTDRTITDGEVLRGELETIRSRGFSTTVSEHLDDTFSVAAPVYGPNGKVIAALGISGPDYRITSETLHRFALIVLDAARRLSQDVGGPNPQM